MFAYELFQPFTMWPSTKRANDYNNPSHSPIDEITAENNSAVA